MSQDVKTYVTCIFVKQQLLFFRTAYDKLSIGAFDFFTRLCPHLVALNNFKDFADKSSVYLKGNKELQKLRKSLTPKLEFVKYIRHRICGHIDNDFIEQAIKWTPQILMDISKDNDLQKCHLWIAELFAKSLIESAINSYQVDNNNQKIFSGEIDIMYPPNIKELMTVIGETNEKSIQFLELLSDVIKPHIHFYTDMKDILPALIEGGEMNFGTKESLSNKK